MNTQSLDEIAALLAANPQLSRVDIGHIDGSIDDEINLQIGLSIHDAGLDTYLSADSFIESGGVDLFCAGRDRIMQRGAHVGVHSWAYNDGSAAGDELSVDDPQHAPYVEYFNIVGCPLDFYWYTLRAASPDDIYVMTERDLIEQAVVTTLID